MSISMATRHRSSWTKAVAATICLVTLTLTCVPPLPAEQASGTSDAPSDQALHSRVQVLEQEVAELKSMVKQLQAGQSAGADPAAGQEAVQAGEPATAKLADSARSPVADLSRNGRSTLGFWRD